MHPRPLHLVCLISSLIMAATSPAYGCETLLSSLRKATNKTFETFAATEPSENFTDQSNSQRLGEVAGLCAKVNPYKLRGKLSKTKNPYDVAVKADSAAQYQAFLNENPDVKWTRSDGQELNEDDFLAIDTLARTLVGEMGNVNRCDRGYMAGAARTIVNRAIYVHNNPKKYKLFGKDSSDWAKIVKSVALSNKQFSLWNKVSYAESRYNMAKRSCSRKKNPRSPACRIVNANESQISVTGRALCPKDTPTDSEMRAWNNATHFAYLAVTNPNLMKQITPDIEGTFYTSNMRMDCIPGKQWKPVPTGHYIYRDASGVHREYLNDKFCIAYWDGFTKVPLAKDCPRAKKTAAPAKSSKGKPAKKSAAPKKKNKR